MARKQPSRNTRKPYDPYRKHWLLREYRGLPAWGAIAFGIVVLAIGILAIIKH